MDTNIFLSNKVYVENINGIKIFVSIFDMPDYGQINFEVFVVDGDECIVKFLRSVVRGAYWKPVLYVWQKGNPNRLPVIGILSAGICLNDAFIAFGRAVMQLVQLRHFCGQI